jgi:hypothetical protein
MRREGSWSATFAIEPRVTGALDLAHSTFAEFVDDDIRADCPADHHRGVSASPSGSCRSPSRSTGASIGDAIMYEFDAGLRGGCCGRRSY